MQELRRDPEHLKKIACQRCGASVATWTPIHQKFCSDCEEHRKLEQNRRWREANRDAIRERDRAYRNRDCHRERDARNKSLSKHPVVFCQRCGAVLPYEYKNRRRKKFCIDCGPIIKYKNCLAYKRRPEVRERYREKYHAKRRMKRVECRGEDFRREYRREQKRLWKLRHPERYREYRREQKRRRHVYEKALEQIFPSSEIMSPEDRDLRRAALVEVAREKGWILTSTPKGRGD
jgi:hypothetical protein